MKNSANKEAQQMVDHLKIGQKQKKVKNHILQINQKIQIFIKDIMYIYHIVLVMFIVEQENIHQQKHGDIIFLDI